MKSALWFTAIVLLLSASAWAEPSTVFVQIRSGRIREKPLHWARPSGEMHYGDALTVISGADGWLRVRSAAGVEGYVHESGVTERRVILSDSAGTAPLKVADSDVVLAGKGFSRDVEELYAGSVPGLDYAAVEALCATHADEAEVAKFLKDGGLRSSMGDAR